MTDPSLPPPAAPSPIPPQGPPARRGIGVAGALILGCGGLFALAFVLVLALALTSRGSPSVSADTVLKMNLGGLVPEHVHRTGLEDFLGQPGLTVREHVQNLKKAACDRRIKGVVVRLEPLAVGWAKVEELRDALLEFKKSGKFLIVYAEYLTESDYALALAADQIVMPKDSPFEFNGLATEVMHYPGLLEKLGVEVQYFRYGKYKSVSGETMGRKETTAPVKEMINATLDGTFAHFVDAVALHRKLPREKVIELIDESHLKSDWALESKLIDRLAYWDEVEADVRTRLALKGDEKVKWVTSSKYRNVSEDAAGLPEGKHTFALIYSQGLIVAGKGDSGGFGGDGNQGSTPIINALRKAVEDKDVKAIILRVDSPGGAGLGCDYVRREVELAKAKKPVIVSMSDVAASGGYWVSMDATAIVAQPTTYTGSVGIYSVVPSLQGTYDKLALNEEIFKRGAHADSIMGARKFTDDEAKRFDDDLHASYLRFVELAAHGRNKKPEEMEELAQGRTWLGDKALELGLVDKLGGFDAAIALAKEKAGVPAGDPVTLKQYEREVDLFSALRRDEDEEEDAPDLGAVLVQKLLERSGYAPLLRRLPAFTPFARAVLNGQERVFPMMEYRVEVH